MYQFEPPRAISVCKAVTFGDALNGCQSDPKKIATKLHVSWGHGSAQQLRRVLESDGDNLHLLTCVDEVLEQRDVCRAFDRAPNAPVARTPAVALSDENLQADLPFWATSLGCIR